MITPPIQFVTYAMEDGTDIQGEFSFTTSLEWFDDREEEIRLIKRTYTLVSEEVLVLGDPYATDDEDDEDDEDEEAEAVHQGIIETMEAPPG